MGTAAADSEPGPDPDSRLPTVRRPTQAARRPDVRWFAALGVLVVLAAAGGMALIRLAGSPASPQPAQAVARVDGQRSEVPSGAPGPGLGQGPADGVGPGSRGPQASAVAPSAGSASTASTPAGSARPWTAWQPSGQGNVTKFSLPAPWTGGVVRQVEVVVYLPAGYSSSTRPYPVVYEAPFSFNLFNSWIGIAAKLDSEIASGALPASIYVFVQPAHSPIHDTECADSVDGREWVDTFLSATLVQAVDQRFRTIPTAAARAVMGFSQGGFCAAMLALQHPDVFGTAISISGYYQAGIVSSQTPKAWIPFGGQASVEAAASPLELVARLSPAQRHAALLVLEADPAQPFYGPQYTAMISAARRAGVRVVALPMQSPHSWPVVAASLPKMLAVLAQQQARLGVFG